MTFWLWQWWLNLILEIQLLKKWSLMAFEKSWPTGSNKHLLKQQASLIYVSKYSQVIIRTLRIICIDWAVLQTIWSSHITWRHLNHTKNSTNHETRDHNLIFGKQNSVKSYFKQELWKVTCWSWSNFSFIVCKDQSVLLQQKHLSFMCYFLYYWHSLWDVTWSHIVWRIVLSLQIIHSVLMMT